MWLVSFAMFLVNPVLGAALLLSAAITTGIKAVKVDAEYARRGELPPTARLVEKWLDRKKAAGTAPQSATVKPYGSWAYAKQRWQAMWEDLGDKHRQDRAAHKKAVAEAQKNGTPLPVKPSLKDRLANWKWSIPNLINPVGEKKPATPVDLADDEDDEPTQPAPTGPRIACDECGATLADTNGGWQHPDGSTCSKAAPTAAPTPAVLAPLPAHWSCQACRNQHPGTAPASGRCPMCERFGDRTGKPPNIGWCLTCRKHGNLTAVGRCEPCVDKAGHGFCGDCHELMFRDGDYMRHGPNQQCRNQPHVDSLTAAPPLTTPPTNEPVTASPGSGDSNTSTEGDTMTAPTTTQQSGEVTGTRSAVAYARAVASAHVQHSGNEGYLTSLATMEIGQGDVDLVRQAMEKSQLAGAAWAAAAESIERNNAALREAYANTPDAANKQANINE